MAKSPIAVGVRQPKRATLRDVARLAGCSTAVVSTVINHAGGRSGASEKLARRIRQVAARLGYRPHFASRSLARRSTETIGVYVPPGPGASLGYRYEGEILVGIEAACQERGYDLLALNLGAKGTPKTCHHKFVEGRIDGLLLLHVPHDAGWVADLAAEYPNIVAVNYYADPSPISTVNFDDLAATRMAVEHLLALGHRRIGYVSRGYDAGPGAILRYDGFSSAMRDKGLPVRREWVLDYHQSGPGGTGSWPRPEQGGDTSCFGALAAEHLAALGAECPTAIVTYDDSVAITALLRLMDLGVDVPGDISVVGVDDTPACQFVRPSLTSVRQPLDQMGRRAAELVIDAATRSSADEPAPTVVHERKPPKLIPRGSTAGPRCGSA